MNYNKELFSIQSQNQPLALRMTPKSLDEFVGQEDLLGKGKLLRRCIESDRLFSAIFFGPSGTGKSALAKIIANITKSYVVEMNAVNAGVSDLRKIINEAQERLKLENRKTILILDEIHRFNRLQQDSLLPDVEKGNITLIGITTENPFFYVNYPLQSRMNIFEFKTLKKEDVKKIILNSIKKDEYLKNYKVNLSDDALDYIASYCEGDARKALNTLEIGILTTKPDENGVINFTVDVAEECIQKRAFHYDKTSDYHYDIISAFIKSIRGSDPDAALYWMSKMLSSGEDPRYIARRVVICASEDVGNADPQALVIATSALEAVEFVGMPEAKIPLAQAVIYVATAPKSNSVYLAISKAMEDVEKSPNVEVPDHLKDPHLDGKTFGHGKDYLYPHNFKNHYVKQVYLPKKAKYYIPTDQGFEKEIKKRMQELDEK